MFISANVVSRICDEKRMREYIFFTTKIFPMSIYPNNSVIAMDG